MLETGSEVDFGEWTRSGCLSQKWMLKPEVDAPQEQGLNNRTNGEDW